MAGVLRNQVRGTAISSSAASVNDPSAASCSSEEPIAALPIGAATETRLSVLGNEIANGRKV
jgi:hypothetical protein